MTEELKLIVNEVNKLLATDYNLISFDSLSVESLLQVLVNVTCEFNVSVKFDVNDIDPEETNKRILESLRKMQYRPKLNNSDPGSFRRDLLDGDKRIIYPILRWIFENQEKIKKTAYLAKYLIPLDLPPEAIAIPEISNIWSQYQLAMEEFKEVHRSNESAKQDGNKARELRNDIGAIETEIENVKKRIERTQQRLDKVPQQELFLESAHNLRIEKERQREIQSQIDEQKKAYQIACKTHDRLERELQTAKAATQGTSPEHLLETLLEETQVLEFMVKQKLPQELEAKQTELQIIKDVIAEPNISREYLLEVQMRVDEVSKEVQKLVETRMTERDTQNDSLAPFRQQAGMVARNKEMAAEQLDQATKELREVTETLENKQQQLQETVGDVILRGDDLKHYVNTLRAKSSVYKQQRAELAALKSESADLMQTLENLKTQDPSLSTSLQQNNPEDENSSLDTSLSRPDSPVETRGMAELSRLVEGLTRAVLGARERITPLSQKIRPLREEIVEYKDDRDSKKQTYDALNATLTAEKAVIQNEISENDKIVRNMEDEWKMLQEEYERSEILLEKVKQEERSTVGISLKETLTKQIREQEVSLKKMQEEQQHLTATKDTRAMQQQMWSDVNQLLLVKLKCFNQAKMEGPGGTLSVDRGAETFTLQ